MQCPTKEELTNCLLGKVNEARAELLLEHAEECEPCGKLIDRLDNASSDRVTDALLQQTKGIEVPEECARMIEGAEIYVQGDFLNDADESATTKQHLLQGTKVRDYEIIRPIGEGGMGAVFLARHNRLKRDVALKVLSLRRSGDREAQRRFEQEMSIVGKLQHPGIVRALDAGEHDGVQYLVMELVNGADLRQIVDAVGPIPVSDACEICRRAAVALAYAHEQQLIHRDVKPSNIMLQTDGAVKVMDLGLARFTDQHRSLTSTQQAMGSLDFMAPEQLRAAEVDQRADVYGLACTLHFLLMGEPPEKRRTASLMISRTPRLDSLRSVLPPPLTKLMHHMLAADPSKRCDSLSDAAEQLAPFCNRADLQQLSSRATRLVDETTGDSKDSITSEIDKEALPNQSTRRRWMTIAAGVVGLLCIAAFTQSMFATAESEDVELSTMPCVSSNIEPVREVPLFQIHDAAVRDAVYNPGTSQLICGSDDTSISIRDLPNQAKLIRVCLFESPITKLLLVPDANQVACLDEDGNVALLQLPAANVVFKIRRKELEAKPIDMQLGDEGILVQLESGEFVSASLRAVPKIEPIERPDSFSEENNLTLSDDVLVRGKTVKVAKQLDNRSVCVVDRNLVRLIDLHAFKNDPDYQHFVYAEHAEPITCLQTFDQESMVLTGDASGEIRLWHAPGRARSAMLLSCASKLDSAELTFLIQRQDRWSRSEFSNSSQEVKFDNFLDEMRIETEIDRNGMRHVLEYRVNPNTNP